MIWEEESFDKLARGGLSVEKGVRVRPHDQKENFREEFSRQLGEANAKVVR